MRQLVDLLGEHQLAAQVLGQLRLDVHGRRLDAAGLRLRWLAEFLGAHIAFEEGQLIPVFAELDHPVPNGSPEVLLRDHALIRSLLERSIAALDGGDPVALCDGLTQLDGVLEHHDLREERYFKARLDAVMDPAVVAELLQAHEAVVGELGPAPALVGTVGPVPQANPGAPAWIRVKWAIATGQVGLAQEALAQVALPEGTKAGRLAEKLAAALAAGDLPAAYHRAQLLGSVTKSSRIVGGGAGNSAGDNR